MLTNTEEQNPVHFVVVPKDADHMPTFQLMLDDYFVWKQKRKGTFVSIYGTFKSSELMRLIANYTRCKLYCESLLTLRSNMQLDNSLPRFNFFFPAPREVWLSLLCAFLSIFSSLYLLLFC